MVISGYGFSSIYFDDPDHVKFYPLGCAHHSLTAVNRVFDLIALELPNTYSQFMVSIKLMDIPMLR